jgi:hypothetical protein
MTTFLDLSSLTPAQRIVLDDARCDFDRGMTYGPAMLHDIPVAEALVTAGIFVKVVDRTQVGCSYVLAPDVFLPTSTPAVAALVVGMPVTYCIGSDRYAEVIVAVERKGQVVIAAPMVNGMTPQQSVEEYRRRVSVGMPDRRSSQTYTRRRDGRYRPTGANHSSLYFGEAKNHWDPSF